MKILILHSSAEIQGILAFTLESEFQYHAVSVSSPPEAFDQLMAGPSDEDSMDAFNLVILEDSAANSTVFKLLASLEKKIPCLIIQNEASKTPSNYPDLFTLGEVRPSQLVNDLKTKIEAAIDDGHLSRAESALDYCRIQTDLLIRVAPLQADIYIQLSPTKFLRIFQRGDTFDQADLIRYKEKKQVKNFFIKNADCTEFAYRLQASISAILNRKEGIAKEDVPELAISMFEAIHQMSDRFGFTPEIQTLVKDNIRAVIQGAKQTESLRDIMGKISADQENYIPTHSVMVAHVASCIALKLGWESATTIEKLSYAAYFHDFSLTSNRLAFIDSMDEFKLKRDSFSEEEALQFLSHAQASAELTQQIKEIPPEVDVIILQHHERADGSGFPRKLAGGNLSALTAVFVIAHDIVQSYYLQQETVEQLLQRYRTRYAFGQFKKIVETLWKTRDSL